ncbi:MAG: hypothetical protein ABW051_03205 [Burkholderiaceae bacterium]
MRFLKPNLRHSLYNLLGRPPAEAADSSHDDEQLEAIREAMLQQMGDTIHLYTATSRKVRYATDIMTLWYLRGEVMRVLAETRGESEARQRMARVTEMFSGHLPRGMDSRPGGLAVNGPRRITR